MKTIQEHVITIFKEIPENEEKENLMNEIISNLNEKVRDLMKNGKEEEDAINKAIVDFGDIGDIKNEFFDKNEIKKKGNAGLQLGFSIWGSLLIIALLVFCNLYLTPRIIWWVYPVFGVLWWPLAMFFQWLKSRSN